MKFRDYSKYEIYEDGRIWSYWTNKFLKPITRKDGYQMVHLYSDEGDRKWYFIHRVIYESVTGEPIPEHLECNHISEDKTDNSFKNINLMTRKENVNWGTRTERARKSIKNNPNILKSVGAFKDGELVMTFKSIKEASIQGFNKGHISACCRGNRKTHKGFEWKYI